MGLTKLSYFGMVLLGSMIYNHKQSQIFCQRHKSTPTQRSLFNFRFTLAREAHIHRAQNIRNNIFVIIFNITKNIVVEKFGDYSRKINPEIVSGCLIILVGFGYLSYNWIGHSH